jgi:hypothetical protein
MVTAKRSMIVLGVLGAMCVSSPSPSLAAGTHVKAAKSGAVVHRPPYRGYESSAYALSPGYAYYGPNVYQRAGLSWDPYGVRWDGGN